MFVRYANWSGFYLTISLTNLWLSPYLSIHYFCRPNKPVNGTVYILSVGSIFCNFLAVRLILIINYHITYATIVSRISANDNNMIVIILYWFVWYKLYVWMYFDIFW
jgi:hypothetical protein